MAEALRYCGGYSGGRVRILLDYLYPTETLERVP